MQQDLSNTVLSLHNALMPDWIVPLPQRLDTFLASEERAPSRAKAQKMIEAGMVRVNGNELLDKETLDKFEEELRKLLANILDPTQPFAQTNDLELCGYCSFKSICNR